MNFAKLVKQTVSGTGHDADFRTDKKLKDELVQAIIDDATATGDVELDVMPFAAMELFGHGFVKEFAAEIQQALAEARAAAMNQIHDDQYACPNCGRMCRADAGSRRLKTLDGEVEFREPKFTCGKCRKSFFPQREVWRIAGETFSPGVKRKVILTAAKTKSYARAE